ncbi:hypothetical protein [Hymenobacter sp. GOD-10R]|uniref:hypothetical protein n=1 Tax=Hymenobacter sp. GOD-10R TaxID=3093922 RepID=UPI002D76C221|nr:hypothetical protein [Hymenobacter sp. GOD-10R]WRQ29335.1 hypothetical protein SD425_03540 [Hymenobacter sp. GOD-10R]
MRHSYLFALLLLVLPLVSCEKDNDVSPEEETEFVPGEVLVGIKETTMVPQTFALVNSRSLEILAISIPMYNSNLPSDSSAYVERALNAKPYINDKGWKASVIRNTNTGKLTVNMRLMNMNLANQRDWLATVQQLQLQEQPTATSYHLKVPVGQEKKWVAELQQQSEVRWAELNNIVHIQLH